MEKLSYYKESGVFRMPSYLISLLVAILLTFILGYIYAVITVINPFIYLNFLATLFSGIAIGFIARFLLKMSHNRNAKSRSVFVIITAITFSFFQWVGFISFVYNGQVPTPLMYLDNILPLLNPVTFFSVIIEINQVGLWEIFGTELRGIVWAIIWIIELGIILGASFMVVYRIQPYPYAEHLAQWYPKFTMDQKFTAVVGSDSFVAEFQENLIENIAKLDEYHANKYSKLHIFYLEGTSNQYLAFENVYIEEQGKGKKDTDIVIPYLQITTEQAKSLLEQYEHKKSSLTAF